MNINEAVKKMKAGKVIKSDNPLETMFYRMEDPSVDSDTIWCRFRNSKLSWTKFSTVDGFFDSQRIKNKEFIIVDIEF